MNFEQIILGSVDKVSALDVLPLVISVAGLCVLARWYFVSGGFDRLDGTPVRRNFMPVYAGFAAVVVWLLASVVSMEIVGGVFGEADEWVQELAMYSLNGAADIGIIVAALWFANKYFCRGIKGFGLDVRTVGRDIKWACVNLLGIYPLVLFGLFAVLVIGGALFGEEFELQKHETLLTMVGDSPMVLRVVAVIFAVVLAPVFEEILFRGMFQTMVRSATGQPWVAVVLTSVIFVMMHASKTHWLALFGLSVGMGYAYEKSGSLYRSIFIHIMFNGISVAGTLLAGA